MSAATAEDAVWVPTGPTLLAEVGVVALPRKGREIRVSVCDANKGAGPAVDVREWMLDAYWDKLRAARASKAARGLKWKGPPDADLYRGPMRKGWWLQPSSAESLAELLIDAVIAAESASVLD